MLPGTQPFGRRGIHSKFPDFELSLLLRLGEGIHHPIDHCARSEKWNGKDTNQYQRDQQRASLSNDDQYTTNHHPGGKKRRT